MGKTLVDNGYMLFCIVLFLLGTLFCIIWLIRQKKLRLSIKKDLRVERHIAINNYRWMIICVLVFCLIGLIGMSFIFAETLVEAMKQLEKQEQLQNNINQILMINKI